MRMLSVRPSCATFVCAMLVCTSRGLVQAQSLAPGTPAATAPPEPMAPAPAAPACPVVDVSLTETIDTKRVKPGDLFRFSTVGPIAYAGGTIPEATPGVGLIVTSDHSKSQGHSGYLVLEARYLERADGSHEPVTLMPGADGHSQAFERAGSSDAGVLGLLPLFIGSAAGVFNTFHHGKDAAVVAGTHLRVLVGDALYAGDCRLGVELRQRRQ